MTIRNSFSKTSIKRTIKEYFMMSVGVFIYAFAWIGIIVPAEGIGGGASGIALLIQYATGGVGEGIPMGVSFFAINAVLLIAATFVLGAKFGVKTIYSIILTSVIMSFLPEIIPPNFIGLHNDKLLSAIFGGTASGFGISLVLMQGGSTGGTDIIAMIVNKYRNISYGRVLMACDFTIIACSYFIFHDLATIIYGFVLTGVFGFIADMMLGGNKQSSQIFITSPKYVEIADMITNTLKRGVTVLDGMGWYTQKQSNVLMVVCRKSETSIMLQQIKEIDPDAFISVSSVTGVYGRGFEVFRK